MDHNLDRQTQADVPGDTPEALPKYLAPRHLTLQSEIKMPSPNLYHSEIPPLLNRVIYGCDLFDETVAPNLTIVEPDAAKMLNPFVYQVHYWLSKETMAGVQRQLKLF